MNYKIIQKLGRAGSPKNRKVMKNKWDTLYGEDNWEIVYYYNDKTYTREEALEKFYNKSYYFYLKNHPQLVDELCSKAKTLYNPHARYTKGVDLQVPAVKQALQSLGKELKGTEEIAIGTWGFKYGKKYPTISYRLSPFKIPLWCNKSISVENFWQKYKYLAVKTNS